MPLLKLYSADHMNQLWTAGITSQESYMLDRLAGLQASRTYKGAYGFRALGDGRARWYGQRTENNKNYRVAYMNFAELAKISNRTGRVMFGTAMRNYNYNQYEQWSYLWLHANEAVTGVSGTYPLTYDNSQTFRLEHTALATDGANNYREITYVEVEIDFDRDCVTVWQDGKVTYMAPLDKKLKDSEELYLNIGHFYGGSTTYHRVVQMFNDTYLYYAPPGDNTPRFGRIDVRRGEVAAVTDGAGDWTATDGGTLEDAVNLAAPNNSGLPGIDTNNTSANVSLSFTHNGFDAIADKLYCVGFAVNVWEGADTKQYAVESKFTHGGQEYALNDVDMDYNRPHNQWAGGSFANASGGKWETTDVDSMVLDLTLKTKAVE